MSSAAVIVETRGVTDGPWLWRHHRCRSSSHRFLTTIPCRAAPTSDCAEREPSFHWNLAPRAGARRGGYSRTPSGLDTRSCGHRGCRLFRGAGAGSCTPCGPPRGRHLEPARRDRARRVLPGARRREEPRHREGAGIGDTRLVGRRKVREHGAPRSYSSAVMPSAAYYLLACSDAAKRVREKSERNNCRASAARTMVTPPGGGPGGPNPGPEPGNPGGGGTADTDGDGYVADDCAPSDPAIHPGPTTRPTAPSPTRTATAWTARR